MTSAATDLAGAAAAYSGERERFFALLRQSLQDGHFVKLVLAKPRGAEPGLERVEVRRIVLKGEDHLCFVYRYATRDVTKNLALVDAEARLQALLGPAFRNAHLLAAGVATQLSIGKRGQCTLTTARNANAAAAAPAPHNREKQRWIEITRPFLAELGVTNAQQQLVPAMARKWKQINKFVEVFAHALAASPLALAKQVRVADFGSGKGYLTFAVHDWLRQVKGVDAQVTGVELRPDMVRLGNNAATRLGLQGLHFELGDVRSHTLAPIDVMIALHACDIATDHAIHHGIRAGASVILCAPCCHKQVRPQLLSPHPLRPILQHGVHLDQEAEMVTDSLRALLLEASGYATQVFEFVSLEHTSKNKMILAVQRASPQPAAADAAWTQVAQVKQFYGLREQCLESLLRA
ncbi:MAG TPA: SAM-dependent methyltransferase [Rubrivivax sp.]